MNLAERPGGDPLPPGRPFFEKKESAGEAIRYNGGRRARSRRSPPALHTSWGPVVFLHLDFDARIWSLLQPFQPVNSLEKRPAAW